MDCPLSIAVWLSYFDCSVLGASFFTCPAFSRPFMSPCLLASLLGIICLQGGSYFSSIIQSAIEECRAVVAICSETYAADPNGFTFMEFTLAKSESKPIIPLWHSGAWPPKGLKLFLTSQNHVPKGSNSMVNQLDYATDLDGCIARITTEIISALQNHGIPPSSSLPQEYSLKSVSVMSESQKLMNKTTSSSAIEVGTYYFKLLKSLK